MPSERELREQLCRIGRDLYDRGHNAPLDGNFSVRLSERYLLASPTQTHKGRLSPDQVVKVHSRDGRPVDPSQRASTEIAMHLKIFEARPDVAAIVHAHCPFTVALSVAGVSLDPPVVPEVILALGNVVTVPYASPTTMDVPKAVNKVLSGSNAFVLERHGPVALGRDLDEAFHRLETVEHTAKITLLARSIGSAEPIATDEAGKLRSMALSAGNLRTPNARAELEAQLVDALAERVLARISSPAK